MSRDLGERDPVVESRDTAEPRPPSAETDADTPRERRSTTGPLRWVIAVAIVVAVLVVVGLVVLHLTGAIGPGVHGGG